MFSIGYIIIIGVFALISYLVSNRLKSKFRKYSLTPLESNLSGKEIAEKMLRDHGIEGVPVLSVPGQLTDHYNPQKRTVNLSPDVYEGRNAAAAAVAAHEVGHAVQHSKAYRWLELRSALVPVQAASGRILNIVILISFLGGWLLFSAFPVNLIGIVVVAAYSILTLFAFVTLPVEFDASNRAMAWIEDKGIVTTQELALSKDALKWAAMTYVVAALSSLVMLLYFIMSFFGGRD